ncbi:MAG: hypothetical protein IPJ82_06775 [Lewinellaceae bacterium]|nr:hypothetical protein [Lewinellaceae bacterium]
MNAFGFLRTEALSLLTRLRQLSPFSLVMPMTPAATLGHAAMESIDRHLEKAKTDLQQSVRQFVFWLEKAGKQGVTAEDAQARFALLKIRFNQILDQLDIFADVLAQRAEHHTGVWVAGLDALAEESLRLPLKLYDPPPVICFLDRGHGAAIRRARTRLPGGDSNPVAVIQVPRERMVGSGIGASLIHEVGHQGASLLSLVETLGPELKKAAKRDPAHARAWDLYNRWISEIVADVWAMGHLGIGATVGLMGVLSLPRYFVFRMLDDDPHPFPWIRVMLSLSFGRFFTRIRSGPTWKNLVVDVSAKRIATRRRGADPAIAGNHARFCAPRGRPPDQTNRQPAFCGHFAAAPPATRSFAGAVQTLAGGARYLASASPFFGFCRGRAGPLCRTAHAAGRKPTLSPVPHALGQTTTRAAPEERSEEGAHIGSPIKIMLCNLLFFMPNWWNKTFSRARRPGSV